MVRTAFPSRPFLIFSFSLLALLLVAWGSPRVATAQTPTTTIQNGNDDTRLQLNFDGGFYVPGTFGPTTPADSIPATGAGTRLMWYPAKAAFRAGRVGVTTPGFEWNPSNVGKYSVALGSDPVASGFAATAMGSSPDATGSQSIAIGNGTTASGEFGSAALGNGTTASGASGSFAVGSSTTASGESATALGASSEASGDAATAMGLETTAATGQSLSIGEYNSANTSNDGTLFVAGNGSSGARSDALVLKQDGDLAVGPSDPQDLRLHVAKDKPNAGVGDSPGANMVLFENTDDGNKPDVLGLQAGPTDPGGGVTYISFYQRDGTTIGSIEGNGSGGINITGNGADFAEELPVASGAETPDPADLVGVRGGAASLSTDGADRVMVASTAPIMTGNTASSAPAERPRVKVAFVGQVPVRVRGDADVGDLVVASGKYDGTARAVAPSDYRRAEHGPIAGQAWSAHSGDGIGTVTVAVGLGRSGAVAERLETQHERIAELQAENEEIKARLTALEAEGAASSVAASLMGSWGLALLLGLGGLAGGILWRRSA